MKKGLILAFMAFASLGAFADWTYGTANFRGDRPSNSRSIGPVTVFYNGSLNQKGTIGDVTYYEGTAEICVIYPKNYKGPKLSFSSSGGAVQIQHLN